MQSVLDALGLRDSDHVDRGPRPVSRSDADAIGASLNHFPTESRTPEVCDHLWSYGVDRNDVAFRTTFPYIAPPHSGGNPWKLNPNPARGH